MMWKVATLYLFPEPEESSGFRPASEQQTPGTRVCGSQSSKRIAGGHSSQKNKWPWQAALLIWGFRLPYCGGVLITTQHVLTAAHCTNGQPRRGLVVRLGAHDFNDITEDGYEDLGVVAVYQHPRFDPDTYKNDVSLLKLIRPVTLSRRISPICLPENEVQFFEGQKAIVIGWGAQYSSGPLSNVLRQTSVTVWKNSDCFRAIGPDVFSSTLCAGETEGGQDSCQGDSGGPLMLQDAHGRWQVIGITSWGYGCGRPLSPGVYARVTSFLSFINLHINNTS